MSSTADVLVIGNGAIGAAVAWRCAQAGHSVLAVDPAPEQGAWHTAAGMLAPVTELHYAETALLRLNIAALARYPAVARELADITGIDIGYRPSGAVAVAWDAADLAALRDLQAFGTGLGLSMRMLTGTELRGVEPALAPGLPGGLLAESDHQVEPRALHRALVAAGQQAGVRLVRSSARLRYRDERVDGADLADGTGVSAAVTVLAAGAWSGVLDGLPDALPGHPGPPVRPVKGQTLRLRSEVPLQRIVRGTVAGHPIYVVPRGDGRIVVGASSEERGFDVAPRAGAVYELLRDAQTLVPELEEATLEEVCTGLRPGSPDNAPIVGESGIDGLVYATGHYRNGILLAPITADAVAELITSARLPAVFADFGPDRFAARAVR